MGMDVHGKNPASKTGEYFRNNAWWWRPLARYACEIAPEITAQCTYWQSNDGDGLNGHYAVALADALQAEIDSGRTMLYEKAYMGRLHMMPDVTCKICDGKGWRPKKGFPWLQEAPNGEVVCNACHGKATVRPDEASYPFSTENVQEFVNFLRDCGGFEIC